MSSVYKCKSCCSIWDNLPKLFSNIKSLKMYTSFGLQLNHTLLWLVYILCPYAPYKLRKVMKGRSNQPDWLFALSQYHVRISWIQGGLNYLDCGRSFCWILHFSSVQQTKGKMVMWNQVRQIQVCPSRAIRQREVSI